MLSFRDCLPNLASSEIDVSEFDLATQLYGSDLKNWPPIKRILGKVVSPESC